MPRAKTHPKTPLKNRRRRRLVLKAIDDNITFEQLREQLEAQEGKTVTDAAMRSFLYATFKSTAWPLPKDQRIPLPYVSRGSGEPRKPRPLTKLASSRRAALERMSKEGFGKLEAMAEVGLNEVAFNRFLHRHYGAVVWPIGTAAAYTKWGAGPALRERDSEKFTSAQVKTLSASGMALVPIEVTDAILAKYISHKVKQGLPLQAVLATLDDIRTCWSEITNLCVEVASGDS